VLIILYTGRNRRKVCNNSLEFRHWPKCDVFALNCTAAVTAVQWYTDSQALLKLIKPTLWPSISQLVNLCTNEVGRIYCTMPYRKQDNVAFDTKMILSVFFMSCGERQKKKGMWTRWKRKDIRPLIQTGGLCFKNVPTPHTLRKTQNVFILFFPTMYLYFWVFSVARPKR